MLTPEALQPLQQYNFDLLAREEPNGRRRLRYIALAHLKEGKSFTEVAAALRTTRHTVARWERWFERDGLKGLGSKPRYWCNQRLLQDQEEAFRVAIEQLQQERAGGRVRGEDIRQLLAQQFDVAYSLNGVYELLKRLGTVWISARSRGPYADPCGASKRMSGLVRSDDKGILVRIAPLLSTRAP